MGVDEGTQHASVEEDKPSRTNREQSCKALSKNLIATFSRCRTSKTEVPETSKTEVPVHAGEQDGVVYERQRSTE